MTLSISTDDDGNAVSIGYKDRTKGIAIIGKTGHGKSTLLTHMAVEDIRQGTCAFVFDPHGDLCRTIINATPQRFKDNLVLIDIDPTIPFHLNPFYCSNTDDLLHLANNANNFVTLFKKILGNDAILIRTDRVLQNVATVLIQNQGHTLLDVPKLLQEKLFRDKLLQNVTNPAVIRFWQQDYDRLYADSRSKADMIDPVLNRIGALIEQDFLYRIFSQPIPTVKFPELFNTRKTYLINLSQLSESNIELLGTILLFQLAIAVYARAATTKRPRVHLYIDEFNLFALSDITARLLKQGRKYELSTTAALQVIADLKDETNRSALLQTGSLICFQTIGDPDAELLSKQFSTEGAPPIYYREEPVMVPSSQIFDWLSYNSHSNLQINQAFRAVWLITERAAPLPQKPQSMPIYEDVEVYKGYTHIDDDGQFTGERIPVFEQQRRYKGSISPPKFAGNPQIKLRDVVSDLLSGINTGSVPITDNSMYYRWLIDVLIQYYDEIYFEGPAMEHYQQVYDQNKLSFWQVNSLPVVLRTSIEPIYQLYQEGGKVANLINGHYDSISFEEFKASCWDFLQKLDRLCQLLAVPANRIMVRSEQVQKIPIPRQVRDIQAEIAMQLATLPPYTMFCRLTTETEMKQCKVQLQKPTYYGEIDLEDVQQKGQTMFGKAWKVVSTLQQPQKPLDGTGQTPPRKTWEEDE